MPTGIATRPPVRMDAEGGPWSISVAETPHDSRSFSLYVKTPTHNLTLTRTIKEIVDLHNKLKESCPGATIPPLPAALLNVPSRPPKRKSTFLNTLSRLTSPASSKTARRSNHSTAPPSSFTSPLVSPQHETADPFASFGTDADDSSGAASLASSKASPVLSATNSISTAVAAYLTTLSNAPELRQARVWRRFVRVRTDDLESVRVERAIKRVRSDLASHASPKSTVDGHAMGKENVAPVSPSKLDEQSASQDDIRKPQQDTQDHDAVTPTEKEASSDQSQTKQETEVEKGADEEATSATPTVDTMPNHRSRSVDRSTRPTRSHTSSASTADHPGSETSASTTTEQRSARKKRSISTDPSGKDSTVKKRSQRKVAVDDFEMLRVLGKGCAGKVLLVRYKSSQELYAMKAITKRHVLAHQELQHTLTEQAVLKKMAAGSKDPFVVKLWWSFHDKENLFLVMDFHPGGDLATQLARWGRLGRDRARFYAAEIVEGCEGLHAAGVIYRDLKPENILIGGDGHIVLTDFGLSKEFDKPSAALTAPPTPSGSRSGGGFYSSVPGTPQPATPPWMKVEKGGELALGYPGPVAGHTDSTSTFCGTAEYLAPEVIQGLAYSYEVDWWSFGTMLYEMLTGITPFWANNHSDMYLRVLQDELQFPDDRAMDPDTKSLIRGLLQRNPALRMTEPRIKRHPYFSMIDWTHVYYKRYIPPYIPPIDPANASDTQNFDDTFLDMEPVLDDPNDYQTDTDQEREQTDTDRTDGDESNTPSQSRSSSAHPQEVDEGDVFDGYSFKGRHSVIIDDGEESESSGDESEDDVDAAALHDIDVAPLEPGTLDEVTEAEEGAEPKTPEARPAVLPEEAVDEPPTPPPKPETPTETTTKTRKSKDLPTPRFVEDVPKTPEKDKPTARPPRANKRREKSGVPALDKYLSDTVDEDTEATGMDDDDEDADWDFIEAVDGEERNGAKGTSLFARGVVDRYKLAVFRKASTPSTRTNSRSFSGLSDATTATAESPESKSPSQRRGRTPLSFRKNPRQFLQPKSSPNKITSKSFSSSTSATLSAASSSSTSAGLMTPSPSGGKISLASAEPPSLRSKESAMSMGVESISSDQSGNGDVAPAELTDSGKNIPEEQDKKKRKLKKYKQNAEKMFTLFSSPRP